MFNFDLKSLKEKVNLKFSVFFIFWSILLFLLGSWSGVEIPSEREISVEHYGILLEKENYFLNKNLNLCKNEVDSLKFKFNK